MAMFWAFALALCLALYVVLDGFDLGVGILFGLAPSEKCRRHMMDAISPVWDGNETWLVLSAATLYAAFPAVYAIAVSAFYLPVIVMLGGLILRGVSFEFRDKGGRYQFVWTLSFFAGSVVAAFAQGCTIGAFVEELPVHDGRFAGSMLTWLSPFAVLCGAGLCLGYAMLGASWLIHKTKAEARTYGYAILPLLVGGVMLFLIVAGTSAFAMDLRITHRWVQRPELFVFPAIGTLALLTMLLGILRKFDQVLYPAGVIMFIAAFLTMVLSVLPYMIPFSVTIASAAAPERSLKFLFWGAGVVILPITLAYTVAVYYIFRGKVSPSS